MPYIMVMPAPLTAACGQRVMYLRPLTAGYGSERVKYFPNLENLISNILKKKFIISCNLRIVKTAINRKVMFKF